MHKIVCGDIPYSRKYWRELNLVVGSQIAIAKALADFNLAVRDNNMHSSNLAVVALDRQTAKFNSPPNFPAIRYTSTHTLLPLAVMHIGACSYY